MSKLLYFFCFSAKRCANSLKSGKSWRKPEKKLEIETNRTNRRSSGKTTAIKTNFPKKTKIGPTGWDGGKCHPALDGGLPGWVEIVVTVFACYNEHQWKRREVQRKNIRMVKLWIWKKCGQTVLCRESRTWLSTVSWLPAQGIRRNVCWHNGLEWAEIPCGRQFNILWW